MKDRKYIVKLYRELEDKDLYLDEFPVSPEGIQLILAKDEETEKTLGNIVAERIRYWITPPKRQ